MTLPLLLGCLWVLAGAGTAFLPMRRQMVPGFVLLLSAPVLITWLAMAVGWWFGLLAVLAFASMFRRPIGALLRWALGRGRQA